MTKDEIRMTKEFLNPKDEICALTDSGFLKSQKLLDRLIDEVGENENHPLSPLMDAIGASIEKHEDDRVPALGQK